MLMYASNPFLSHLLRTAVLLYHSYGVQRSSKNLLNSYDFVIVGGGTAGAIVANKLSENPRVTVLLIESGGSGSHITDIPFIPSYINIRTNVSRRVKTTIQESGVCDGQPCELMYAHILGGGSTINGMAYTRASVQDLDDWRTQYGIETWTYANLLPYMVELETYADEHNGHSSRGTKGPVHVTRQVPYPFDDLRERWKRAALGLGYEIGDYNGPRQTYFADVQKNIRAGVRQSTDNVYLKPVLERRSNLHVIMFSHVMRILFNGKRAIGVAYSSNGTLYNAMANCEVILSAGVLGSPQLLLLSGVGPVKQLLKFNITKTVDLQGVGENLQDHLSVDMLVSTNQSYPNDAGITRDNYNQWAAKKTGVLAAAHSVSKAYLTSQYSSNRNDSQLCLALLVSQDKVDPTQMNLFLQLSSARTYSRGNVRLHSLDARDNVVLNPRYMTRIEDRHNLVEGMKRLLQLMKSMPFQSIGAKLIVDSNTKQCSKHFQLYSDDWLLCFIRKNAVRSFHSCCSCRMGSLYDPMAVVDESLRVRNLKGLRIIDASVMPQITRGDINAPTMMIALKGADMIRQHWSI